MRRDTDAEGSDNRIDDVDQIFESFVKKKLQQLGMKRAAAKAVNSGHMSKHGADVKMRLGQSLHNGDGVSQRFVVTSSEESEYQPPVPVMVKKKEKKEKKSKKKKKEKKKKKDKADKKIKKADGKPGKDLKKIAEYANGKSQIDLEDASHPTAPLKVHTTKCKNAGEISLPREKKDTSVQGVVPGVVTNIATSKVLSPSKAMPDLLNPLNPKMEVKTDKEIVSPTAQPKKDIAAIKMKVELLRAKSAKEEVRNKTESLLQMPKDQKAPGEGKSKQVSTARESRKRHSSSRSRSRSRSKKRSRHHSRHRSRSRSRSGSRTRRARRHRSRSPHRRSHHRKRKSRSSDRRSYKSKRSRRSHSPRISAEDKVRLLEIAKTNALAQHKATTAGVSISSVGQLIKAGSMTVTELTNMCKDIVEGKEAKVAEVPKTKAEAEQMIEEVAERVTHHPFAVRDKPIVFNIKPNLSLPPPAASRPVAVLSKEFPVSCGQQHRRKEVLESVYGKWEVVAKDEATKNAVKELVSSDKVFVEPEPVELDLGSVMAERATAAKQLQENPNSQEAQSKMLSVQQRLDRWTQSKQIIGQFTGQSGIQPMPRAQLESGRPAWFKQEDLRNAKHVSGIGKSLLQKMGWKPGMPLGKTMHGQLEPLSVNVKSDRRGLSSFMEAPPVPNARKQKVAASGLAATMKDLSDKHPVSALMEVCSKRRWQPPSFSLVDPCNTKIFTFKVTVCNDEYTGKPASNKKQAKLKAAEVALQCMGLIPRLPNT